MGIVESILSKTTKHADTVGFLYGSLAPWARASQNLNQPIMDLIIADVKGGLANLHIDKAGSALLKMPFDSAYDEHSVFWNGAKALGIGWVGKEMDLHPKITQISNAVYNAGVPIMFGAMVTTFIRNLGSPSYPPYSNGSKPQATTVNYGYGY